MNTITFECVLISDYFGAGADGLTPELRPSSIKGALRFWWRALNGHRSLKELKLTEDRIFGGGGENATKSRVIIRCQQPEWNIQNMNMYARAGKNIQQKGVAPENCKPFNVTLSLTESVNEFNIDQLKSLFEVVCLLGGLGKRSRRGRGCIAIQKYSVNKGTWLNYSKPQNLVDILKPISTLSNYFEVRDNAIFFNYSGVTDSFPFIQKVQVGKSGNNILRTIDNTSHSLLQQYGIKYEATLGHTNRRFASPIYTSVFMNSQGQLVPIISSLKNVPDFGHKEHVSGKVADEFKNSILL